MSDAPRRSWIVGALASCDVVIDHPTVSGRHCRLTEQDGSFLLEDLRSTNGTYVRGERISQATRVTCGDDVRLGRDLPMPWPEANAAPARSGTERVIAVGRDPGNDVVLDFPVISGRHALITLAGGRATIQDLGSTNGTAISSPDRKITSAVLSPTDTVYFGSFPIPAARLLGGEVSLGGSPHARHKLAAGGLLLGRDPACDVFLDVPTVSWRHARLLPAAGGATVEDLGSTNGTFLNGRKISGVTAVAAGDSIGLGSYSFKFTGLDVLEQRDHRGNVAIEARGICVDVPGRRLVEAVSLTIFPSELVGLMGPSGAGKSTLMGALNGNQRPSAGTVLFNNLDLYGNFGQFRSHIGYVPQDDIIHRDLTVRQALYFSARLRLPRDMRDKEIHARITQVLADLSLQGTDDVLIGSAEKKGISGGQRKRVNLAMELLTDPVVLFLDEPTTGLSSKDAFVVMERLRELAKQGKTILLTIHQPSRRVYRLLDSVVILSQDAGTTQPGRMVYFGAAYPDALHFLNPAVKEAEPSPDEILDGLGENTEEWLRTYAASPYKRQYVDQRASSVPLPNSGAAAPPRRGGVHQWWTLVRRNLAIKARDRSTSGVLLAQAPLIALLISLVFGADARLRDPTRLSEIAGAKATVLFLMAIAAIWFGCSNSAREIAAEWAIFRRERMVNLTLPSYIGSKIAVLGGLCLAQCSLLLFIVAQACDLQGSMAWMLVILMLAAVVAVAVGLLISALARSSESPGSVVPLALLPMVILGGVMYPVSKMAGPVRALAALMPSRWAFEGLLLAENRGCTFDIMPFYFPAGERSPLPLVVTVLVLMLLALIGGVGMLLSRDLQRVRKQGK